MSDVNSHEQRVRGTVVLASLTALVSVALGALSLAGGSGLWPDSSRGQVYLQQSRAADDSTPAANLLDDCADCTTIPALRGSLEFAPNTAALVGTERLRARLEGSGRRAEAGTSPRSEARRVRTLTAASVKKSVDAIESDATGPALSDAHVRRAGGRGNRQTDEGDEAESAAEESRRRPELLRVAERLPESSGEEAEWEGKESARIKVVRVQKCPHETDVPAAEKSVAGVAAAPINAAPAGDSAARPQLPIVSIDFLPTLTEAIGIELLTFADDVTDGPRVKESDCTGEDEDEETRTPEAAVERPEKDSDSDSVNGLRPYGRDVFGPQED